MSAVAVRPSLIALRLFGSFGLVLLSGLPHGSVATAAEPAGLIELNDDGAWCWFQDERAVVDEQFLLCGSVANGTHDPERRGDIELNILDMSSGQVARVELADQLQPDDHNVPALWVRPDRNILAVFAKHGSENQFLIRESNWNSAGHSRRVKADAGVDRYAARHWLPARTYAPSATSRITYANLLFLAEENDGHGRLYNFYRGLDASFKPSYVWSDDWGSSWTSGNIVINVPLRFRHRPYVKYCSNGRDTIHLFYTDGHPRDFDNSVYHVYYRDGVLHRSDGTPVCRLEEGLREPGSGTCVFAGDADHVAWVSDLHLDGQGRPRGVFSVQRHGAHLASGAPEAGQDHRYYFAIWDGQQWNVSEIAYAGSRLYAGEDDYTGNICLDPDRADTVYCSTNVDPVNGEPLISRTDGQRHYEIYIGHTHDRGANFQWAPVTQDSTVDNLRPIVPAHHDEATPLLWYRGVYRTYRDYQTQIVCLFIEP